MKVKISRTTNINNHLTKQERLVRILFASAAAATLIAIYFWNPTAHPLTVCKFRQLTGISCPTCGMSRSVHAAAHFHFLESLKFHSTGWVLFAGLALFFGWTATEAVQKRKLNVPLSSRGKKLIFYGLMLLWFFSWMINVLKDLILIYPKFLN